MRMHARFPLMTASVLLAVVFAAGIADAQDPMAQPARTGRFSAGAGIGVQGSTPDDTAFAFNLSGDYYLTNNLSIGPLVQFGFTPDLFQFGLTAQAKYIFDIPQVPAWKPHVEAGIGFLLSDLDKRGSNRTDNNYLIPVGVGLEYRLGPGLALDSTVFFNFTDVHNRTLFLTWVVGARIPF
jgi:hypothetical protein